MNHDIYCFEELNETSKILLDFWIPLTDSIEHIKVTHDEKNVKEIRLPLSMKQMIQLQKKYSEARSIVDSLRKERTSAKMFILYNGVLCRLWTEESVCAAGELARLSMVLEPDDYFKVVEARTQAKQLISQKKETKEQARSDEEMKNTQIEDIIIEQNLPTLFNWWKDSKVLLPTRHLAAAVYYFIYSQADQVHLLMNKFMADKFKLSSNNLHWIITGRRYTGGHKTKLLVAPKLTDLPFLSDQPAEGTCGAKKRKKDDGSKGNE